MSDYATEIPKTFYAGDTLQFVISLSDYQASDGYTLNYVLINSTAKITFPSSAYQTYDHLVNVSATTTSAYTAGVYRWQAYVTTTGGLKYTVDSGEIEILTNLVTQTTYDARPDVQIIFEAIEAAIMGKADDLQLSRKIGDREIRYMSVAELLQLRNFYKQEYMKTISGGYPKTIKIQFTDI